MAWFQAGELEKALELWPGFIERWEIIDHADYSRHVDDELRILTANGVAPLEVAPVVVDELIAWCAEKQLDPEQAESRSQYAAHLSQQRRTISWPPAKGQTCWCGSGRRYGRCCGVDRPLQELPEDGLD